MAAVVDSKDENENNESEVLLKADDYSYYNLDATVENDMFNPRTRLQIQTDRESTISDTDSALLLADPEVDTINTDPDGREIPINHKNWHCHAPLPGEDKTAKNQLIGVSVLCFAFMIAELAGGLIAHSLAIATDATHLACDLAGFLISLFAIWLAEKPPTKRMSFGWFRAEVVGALISILIIWVVTAVLIYLAILRIHHGEYDVVEEKPMLVTASLGVIFNILMGIILHSGLCKGCRIKSSFGHGHSHGGGGHGHSHGGDHEHSHGEGGHSHSGGGGHSHSHGSDGHSHDGAGHSHGGHSHDDHTHTCSKYNSHDKQSHDTHRRSNTSTAGVSSQAGDLLDVAKPIVIVSDGEVQSSQAAAGSSPLFLNSTHDSYSLPTLEQRDESDIFDENIVVSDQDDVALLDDTFHRAPQDARTSNRISITHVASMESTRRKQNINVRAAFIHVVGDLVQSIGVLVAAIIISFRPDLKITDLICTLIFSADLKIADPICTFIFSFLVLCTTISVLRDILLVIMEGVPRDADFEAIRADLSSLPGVLSVHSLNVWALTLDKLSVCVHLAVVVPPIKWEAILVSGTDLLRTKYDVHQSTIQIEVYNEQMTTACQRC